MPRVVHFDISVDDSDRAIGFYSQTFGWKFEKWNGPIDYWMIMTGDENQPGIDGGLVPREDPSQSTINTIDVPNVDEFVKKVQENGGKIINPKSPIPGVGYIAMCLDTEGNTFAIMDSDETAQ